MVDLCLRRLSEDVGGSHFVLFQVTLLGTEGEVPMPPVVLVQKSDEEARPAFSLTFEEGYGTAAAAVQNRGTPGFWGFGDVPEEVKRCPGRVEVASGWRSWIEWGTSGKRHSCEAGKQMVIVIIPTFPNVEKERG
jgi:hypothetical protein